MNEGMTAASRRDGCAVRFRAEDHQLVRPVIVTRGKKKDAMKGPDDFFDVLEVVPGEGLMRKPGAFGCQLGGYT